MQRVMFSWPNRAEAASFSGGSWSATASLTNLASRFNYLVARSTDTAPSSSTFDVDLGTPRPIRHVALSRHNLSSAGVWRVRGSNTAGDFSAPSADSGWCSPWIGFHAFGELAWGAEGFWGGLPTMEELAGYPTLTIASFAESVNARYWRIDLSDLGNVDGYLEIARLWIADAWQPAYNMSYGTTLGWEDPSGIETALGGAEYFDERTKYRVWKGQLGFMNHAEGYGRYLEMTRQLGITREVLLVPDADDTAQTLRRTFIGRLKALDPLNTFAFNLKSGAVEIKETV